MTASHGHEPMTSAQMFRLVFRILSPERQFYWLAAIYGIGIGLLTLATPIAVQVLINTVAYTGLTSPLIVLSLTLFGLLLASGLLNALRVHLMELFARRFYARMVSDIALKALYAQNPFFSDQRRAPLFNRYFDIIAIQKSVPILFIGGFTVILQMVVGFVLVSFYHPLFLAFNVVTLMLVWLTWSLSGTSAMRSAIGLSQRKHETAAWIEGLAASNGYFKSDRHVAHALDRTEEMTRAYVDQHKVHFRRHFTQTVSFLVLYALASATLLGLGGWLVIRGQLTLGQLVAAELVLSAAFFGISQLGTYLNYFYDLCAASEELSMFDTIEQEEPTGREIPERANAGLVFDGVRGDARGIQATLNFAIPSGACVQVAVSHHGMQRLFTSLLKRFVEPEGGIMTLGGDDITATEVHTLRREVRVLDRPTVVEMSIRNYLTLSAESVRSSEMLDIIRLVGLDDTIEQLPDGLDTELAPTGYPLSSAETMQLKLAAALLAQPRVLVMSQLFDMLPDRVLCAAIAKLRKTADTTVIVFTTRERDLGPDFYLYMAPEKQVAFDHFSAFADLAFAPPGRERSDVAARLKIIDGA